MRGRSVPVNALPSAPGVGGEDRRTRNRRTVARDAGQLIAGRTVEPPGEEMRAPPVGGGGSGRLHVGKRI